LINHARFEIVNEQTSVYIEKLRFPHLIINKSGEKKRELRSLSLSLSHTIYIRISIDNCLSIIIVNRFLL